MNNTYQPSGKISLLFWPAAAAMLVITAAGALLCVFGVQMSRATLLDMWIYFMITKCVANLGALLCIRGGRVRRPALARAAGMALALWYWVLLIAFYLPVKALLTEEKPVFSLKDSGVVITGKSGNPLFTMPGIVCAVVLVILFLGAAGQFGFVFWKQGRAPFCEAAGKWAREMVINLRCQEQEVFLSRLLLGDTAVLADSEPLVDGQAEDCYFKVSVYAADGKPPVYVSVIKREKVKKERGPRSPNRKKPVYEEELVAEYLAADSLTGYALLSRSKTVKKGLRIR